MIIKHIHTLIKKSDTFIWIFTSYSTIYIQNLDAPYYNGLLTDWVYIRCLRLSTRVKLLHDVIGSPDKRSSHHYQLSAKRVYISRFVYTVKSP